MSEHRFLRKISPHAGDNAAGAEKGGEGSLRPSRPRGKKGRLAAEYVVKVAVMSALLTALKFALSFIPNVEVVTLLIMVYAAVFGAAYALPAVLVFCAVEVAIYGAGSWVVLYFSFVTKPGATLQTAVHQKAFFKMRGSGLMLCQRTVRLYIRKNLFSEGAVVHWHRAA